MKKIITLLLLAIPMMFGFSAVDNSNTNSVDVVDKAGFMTLDINEEPNNTTVVAYVDKVDNTGAFTVNVFDNNDKIDLDMGDYSKWLKKGDVVLITFTHDYVTNVKLNDLNIEGKVMGQSIVSDDLRVVDAPKFVQAEDGSWVNENFYKKVK